MVLLVKLDGSSQNPLGLKKRSTARSREESRIKTIKQESIRLRLRCESRLSRGSVAVTCYMGRNGKWSYLYISFLVLMLHCTVCVIHTRSYQCSNFLLKSWFKDVSTCGRGNDWDRANDPVCSKDHPPNPLSHSRYSTLLHCPVPVQRHKRGKSRRARPPNDSCHQITAERKDPSRPLLQLWSGLCAAEEAAHPPELDRYPDMTTQ